MDIHPNSAANLALGRKANQHTLKPGTEIGKDTRFKPGEQGYTPEKGKKRPLLRLDAHLKAVLDMDDEEALKDLSGDNKTRKKARTLAHRWIENAETDAAFAKLVIDRVDGPVTQKVEIDDLREVKDDDLYAEGAAIIAKRTGGFGGDSEA